MAAAAAYGDLRKGPKFYIQTHTHPYMYIYIYIIQAGEAVVRSSVRRPSSPSRPLDGYRPLRRCAVRV